MAALPPYRNRMTTFFISRHPGALDWITRQGIAFDRHEAHLDLAAVKPGDIVIGTLPVNLAAEVCALGAAYVHLSLRMAAKDRGRELSAEELDGCEAMLQRYDVLACGNHNPQEDIVVVQYDAL
jgi:CRISPR-associated protein Csx16